MRQLARMALAAVTLAACAHEVVHLPASERSTPDQVSYALPSGGQVDVAVVAYDRIETDAAYKTSFPSLRVRMTLTNRSAQPWSARPDEQLAFIEDYGPSFPAAASKSALVVAPGETRTLELFYPVPKPELAQAPPNRLSLQWRVHLPGAIVVGDRVRLDHELASIAPPRS
jgi:hypothetical protein